MARVSLTLATEGFLLAVSVPGTGLKVVNLEDIELDLGPVDVELDNADREADLVNPEITVELAPDIEVEHDC